MKLRAVPPRTEMSGFSRASTEFALDSSQSLQIAQER